LFLLIPARALAQAVWSFALTIIQDNAETLRFRAVKGLLRITPFAGAAMIMATLSTGAFPLLAGFPARLALWEGLSRVSLSASLWMGIGIIGLLTSAFRSLAVVSMAEEYTTWERRESLTQVSMLGLGMIGLVILGLFPQTIQYFLSELPTMFERLGR
jgi:formate hydrogenlyase subunit 3/multisubunit Na+/H+ antiporter MnhD subunit